VVGQIGLVKSLPVQIIVNKIGDFFKEFRQNISIKHLYKSATNA